MPFSGPSSRGGGEQTGDGGKIHSGRTAHSGSDCNQYAAPFYCTALPLYTLECYRFFTASEMCVVLGPPTSTEVMKMHFDR